MALISKEWTKITGFRILSEKLPLDNLLGILLFNLALHILPFAKHHLPMQTKCLSSETGKTTSPIQKCRELFIGQCRGGMEGKERTM